MGSGLATLTSSDIQHFERDGYVVVRQDPDRAGQAAGCPPAMRRAATALKSPSCCGVRR
jgi:hypothetical protein